MDIVTEEVHGHCRVTIDDKVSWCMGKPGHKGAHVFYPDEWTCECGHSVAIHNDETRCINDGCLCKHYIERF